MIKICCRTNLDLTYESWPDALPTVPRVGEFIQSSTRHSSGFHLYLEVVSVTWTKQVYSKEWIPVVELHIPKHRNWSIREFYEWYAPLVGRSVHAFI